MSSILTPKFIFNFFFENNYYLFSFLVYYFFSYINGLYMRMCLMMLEKIHLNNHYNLQIELLKFFY